MSMKTKGVAFNMADPDQKDLYEWAMTRTNFSAYVKRLIQADRDTKKRTVINGPKDAQGVQVIKVHTLGETFRHDH